MFRVESFTLRAAGSLIFLAAALLFLMPFFLGIKNIGNIFGLFISGLMFVFFTFNKTSSNFIEKLYKNNFGKTIVIAFIGFIIIGTLTALILSGFMVKSILDKPKTQAPAILLGCKVKGETPSLMLGRRIKAAYEYLNENSEAIIIVSGGQGEGEDISEAKCMKKYLVNYGIAPERIIMEDKSEDTYQNINFSKEYLEKYNLGTHVVIITDSFHQYRASLIAKKFNLTTDSISANTPIYLLPTYWVREWFGIIEQIFLK